MRLFLSSYRAGRHETELQNFLGKIDKVAVITNAKDYKTDIERQKSVTENFDWWRSIGFKPTEIDLRPYFHKDGAEKLLKKHNFIWLAGGNVFLLRRALRYTGLDKYLGDMTRKNEIILGGESAGALVTGPTLRYSERNIEEDRETITPEGYNSKVIWDGLNLISYVPVPHYGSAGFDGIDQYINKLEKKGIPNKRMTDDQAIIISGFSEELLA